MKPEQLKVIAEGMGYEIEYESYIVTEIDKPDTYIAFVGVGKDQIQYNPLTNNDQMVEIITKLQLVIDWAGDACFAGTYPNLNIYDGKTINEAVCNAAYEVFK